jgi:hypothetical protein
MPQASIFREAFSFLGMLVLAGLVVFPPAGSEGGPWTTHPVNINVPVSNTQRSRTVIFFILFIPPSV